MAYSIEHLIAARDMLLAIGMDSEAEATQKLIDTLVLELTGVAA